VRIKADEMADVAPVGALGSADGGTDRLPEDVANDIDHEYLAKLAKTVSTHYPNGPDWLAVAEVLNANGVCTFLNKFTIMHPDRKRPVKKDYAKALGEIVVAIGACDGEKNDLVTSLAHTDAEDSCSEFFKGLRAAHPKVVTETIEAVTGSSRRARTAPPASADKVGPMLSCSP